MRKPLLLALAALLAALALAGCEGGDMWCEETVTGARVDEQYCDIGGPGYEWKTQVGDGGTVRHDWPPAAI